MKIDILSSDGIQASEKEALQRMREAFNASPFSIKWQGYAAFMMIDTVYRDREIDLVLLTEDRLLLIELKKWRGKVTAVHDHWHQNGDDMGRSAVKVLADKWKILGSKIRDNLPRPANTVHIDYRVVMCGSADYSSLPDEERAYMLTLEEFLKTAREGRYRQVFQKSHGINPTNSIQAFTQFFRGNEFKPTGFSFHNFQIQGEATFPHPDGLYKEYKSVKKDDTRHEALLRRWDFSALVGIADTIDERARIALREHKVLGYIHEQQERLDTVALQPLSHPTRDDIDADFCELYRLPARQLRLNEFVQRHGPDMAFPERLALVKVLLSHFADLHDIGVAHRDISDHSLWLERPSKVSISSFLTAYFPEVGSVGPLRQELRAGRAMLPEDTELGQGEHKDAFRGDVYFLGVAAYHLLFLQLPPQSEELFQWALPQGQESAPALSAWLEQSLELVPSARFANARTMLDALNALSLGKPTAMGIDMRAFEPYRSEVIPASVYRLEEDIKFTHHHLYRSSIGGRPVVVKVWYGRRPDPKRPEETHALKAFLDKARQVKSQPCAALAPVVDFGLSDAGAFLVQEWTEGEKLVVTAADSATAQEMLRLCHRLVLATRHMHGLELQHGDLHPDNVLVTGGEIRFIDAIDMLTGGSLEPVCPAYAPKDYTGISHEQRDCYAVAKMCGELLEQVTDWGELVPAQVLAEIKACLSSDARVHALDRIDEALNKLLNPPALTSGPRLAVQLKQLTSALAMAGDNGYFHIGVSAERVRSPKRMPQIELSVAGVNRRLLILLESNTLEFAGMRMQNLPHSRFLQFANQAAAIFKVDLWLEPATVDDVSALLGALESLEDVKQAIERVRADLLGLDEPTEDSNGADEARDGSAPGTEALWRAILDAEEATLPEVEVAGPVVRETGPRGKLRIPYRKEGEELDYETDAKVDALQEINGELMKVGEVDVRETGPAFLVLDKARNRMQTQLGERIRLRSKQDLVSFRRRQQAITRILSQESVLPDLLRYFDPAICPQPLALANVPTEAELDVYDRLDADGKLVFTLNARQRAAFGKLWSMGPLSLLQGPPGTGKTSFIASFVHYALSQGAQSILLASQSHEAVNNAAEKVIELCLRTGLPLDVVRFGAEGMVSDPLRPYHSASILQAYRDLFRSEMRQRVAALNRNLGLPNAFVEAWFDIDFHLGELLREIERLERRLALPQLSRDDLSAASLRLGQRLDRFQTIAQVKFGVELIQEPAQTIEDLRTMAMRTHNVTSPDAVARLDQVMAMAREWVDRLGTLRGNFEEFLAKTRSLVCGTCVGLGRSEFGVVKNRYDWVIVDEAARATPGELAVAIQSGRRVLLVGDHRQLPPLYTDPMIRKISQDLQWPDRNTLKRSDFERAFESEYGRQVGATLQTQYRMAPPIGAMVSDCFYPVALEAGRGNPPDWFSHLPVRLRAVVTWIDTSEANRQAFERPRKPGFENQYEAQEVLNLLRTICMSHDFTQALLAECSEDERPIGVICMYVHQMRLLQRMLSEQDWATGFRRLVKIDTVDSYQGKENRIIIVATTRNNDLFDQGFLSSKERVNVAISRAMDRLIIVGAARMWRERHQQSPMGRVLSYIESHRNPDDFAIVPAVHASGEAV